MSLATNLTSAFTRVATEFKAVYTKVGDLTSLSTTAKGNLVAAINEVNSKPSGTGGAAINDSAPSTTTTYSSSKIAQVATDAASSAVNTLVAGAPAALDTLDELAAAIGDNSDFAGTVTAALGNRLRFDAAQTLTAGQKTQGLSNLGAVGTADIGDPNTNYVAAFEAALA
jgi:hypothetical protein